MKRKNLIIVVSSYPYGLVESYLEDELKVLENEFDKVFLVLPESQLLKNTSITNYYLPKNLQKVVLFNIEYGFIQKLKSILVLFKRDTFSELFNIKNIYKLPITFLKIKVLVSFYQKGIDFKKAIKQMMKTEHLKAEETVIYSYWANEFTVGLAQLHAENPAIKCYTRAHSGDLYFDRNTENYLPWRKFIMDKLNAVLAISKSGKEYYESTLNQKNNDRVGVSYLGTTQQGFANSCNVSVELNILTLAYLTRVKQIEKLIDALSEINHTKIKWTHMGGGNKEYEDYLKVYAPEKLGNKPNISFEFLSSVPKSDVFNQIIQRNIHVLINTSKYEGIPVSMMEVMSMGIPVIGLNVGAVSEIVVDGESGKLLDASATSKQISDAILYYSKLSNDTFMIEKQKAYNFWNNNFNAHTNYKSFANTLKS